MEIDSGFQYIKVEPCGLFNCDFCASSFRTRAERKTHTIEHFERKRCLDCKKQIIRIDDDWYELHTMDNCNKESVTNIANYDDHDDDDDINIDHLVKQEEFELNPTGLFESTLLLTDTTTKCGLKEPIQFVNTNVLEKKPISKDVLIKKNTQKDDSQQQPQNNGVGNRPKKPNISVEKNRTQRDTSNSFDRQTCPICNKTPKNLRSLKRHIKKWHENELDRKPKKNRLQLDTSNPFERQVCPICNKIAKNLRSLKWHIKEWHENVHERKQKIRAADLRPFGDITCDICNHKLKDLDSARRHMNYVHLGKKRPVRKDKKTYTCDICSSDLASFLSLKYHMNRHSKETLYICNYCGRSFYTRCNLVAHENRHTGAKIYSCKTCGKGFRDNSNLTRHIRMHTGEKPYKCPIEGCTRAYAYYTDLKRHKFGVHRIYSKKHVCPICSKVYPENKLLRKHLESQKCV